MGRCVNRFFAPILLSYLGFLLLGSLVGLTVGLFVGSILTAIIIGTFIGFAIAIIVNAFIIITINKTCFRNDHYCNE